MDTVRNILMFYIVKLLVPQSPAYGNTLPFIKQQPIQQIITKLQIGDIIFTKTNNSWYQICRRLLQINYDHVSVVINKNQVIHISPPIISKLQLSHILISSRQPLILRLKLLSQQQKQLMLNILLSFIGQKYNQSAIPTMFKNQIISKIFQVQKKNQFVFQNMKYSKICTQAILYAICKGNQNMIKLLQKYIENNIQYKRIGYIMPDQMLQFINTITGVQIIYKNQCNQQDKMLITKIQQNIQLFMNKISFITQISTKLSNSQAADIFKQLTKFSKKYLLKQHPLIRILSILAIFVQIKYGGKLNKYLLVYSLLATMMVFRMMPEQTNLQNFKMIFKKMAKL